MRTLITLLISTVLALAVTACGTEIGDSCQYNSECSATGDRVCSAMPNGYCTVIGCDYNTCPDEAVCVRFFSVGSTNILCNPSTEDRDPSELAAGVSATDDCTVDELCTLGGSCVPRAAETRYCMKKCGDNGDCRDRYHCRTHELMTQYGGEPVTAPNVPSVDGVQPFCAVAPVAE